MRIAHGGEAGGPVALETRRESIFDYLERETRRLSPTPRPELPFGFACGFAGYLGYELKAECGGDAAHRASTPDAFFVFADRLVAFDHAEGCAYLLALSANETSSADAKRWLHASAAHLERSPAGGLVAGFGPYRGQNPPPNEGVRLALARSRERYLGDVEACRRRLRAGDSYEICLTNRVSARTQADPLDLYRALRRANPAPFASYLRLGATAVLSSSPERFLRVGRDGGAEAKPIKGTSRRGETAAEDARLARELVDDEQEQGRERDDRRPPAQRPRPRLRVRQRRGAEADGARELRDGPPAGQHDPRPSAARGSGPPPAPGPAFRRAR